MKKFTLKIGEVIYQIRSEIPFCILGHYQDYLLNTNDYDYSVIIRKQRKLNNNYNSEDYFKYLGFGYLNSENIEQKGIIRGKDLVPEWISTLSQNGEINVSVYEEQLYEKLYFKSIFHMLNIEKTLLKYESLILHSSYIRLNNSAYLFTAPSGTGKSTQAELWKKYRHAQIINGDKTLLSHRSGSWTACGFPLSGTSKDCLNVSSPLKCLIVLEKGIENRITVLSKPEAFKRIYSQCVVHFWDSDSVSKAMKLVESLIQNIPVVLYSCTKEEDAVNVFEQYLVKEGLY